METHYLSVLWCVARGIGLGPREVLVTVPSLKGCF